MPCRYIIALLRKRWRVRQTGAKRQRDDMLDRIFAGIEACTRRARTSQHWRSTRCCSFCVVPAVRLVLGQGKRVAAVREMRYVVVLLCSDGRQPWPLPRRVWVDSGSSSCCRE